MAEGKKRNREENANPEQNSTEKETKKQRLQNEGQEVSASSAEKRKREESSSKDVNKSASKKPKSQSEEQETVDNSEYEVNAENEGKKGEKRKFSSNSDDEQSKSKQLKSEQEQVQESSGNSSDENKSSGDADNSSEEGNSSENQNGSSQRDKKEEKGYTFRVRGGDDKNELEELSKLLAEDPQKFYFKLVHNALQKLKYMVPIEPPSEQGQTSTSDEKESPKANQVQKKKKGKRGKRVTQNKKRKTENRPPVKMKEYCLGQFDFKPEDQENILSWSIDIGAILKNKVDEQDHQKHIQRVKQALGRKGKEKIQSLMDAELEKYAIALDRGTGDKEDWFEIQLMNYDLWGSYTNEYENDNDEDKKKKRANFSSTSNDADSLENAKKTLQEKKEYHLGWQITNEISKSKQEPKELIEALPEIVYEASKNKDTLKITLKSKCSILVFFDTDDSGCLYSKTFKSDEMEVLLLDGAVNKKLCCTTLNVVTIKYPSKKEEGSTEEDSTLQELCARYVNNNNNNYEVLINRKKTDLEKLPDNEKEGCQAADLVVPELLPGLIPIYMYNPKNPENYHKGFWCKACGNSTGGGSGGRMRCDKDPEIEYLWAGWYPLGIVLNLDRTRYSPELHALLELAKKEGELPKLKYYKTETGELGNVMYAPTNVPWDRVIPREKENDSEKQKRAAAAKGEINTFTTPKKPTAVEMSSDILFFKKRTEKSRKNTPDEPNQPMIPPIKRDGLKLKAPNQLIRPSTGTTELNSQQEAKEKKLVKSGLKLLTRQTGIRQDAKKVMCGRSATEYFKELSEEKKEIEPCHTINPETNQEWCHLFGHGDGGCEIPGNFVAGSKHCNTEQLAIETYQRIWLKNEKKKDEEKKNEQEIRAKVTAYLFPGDGVSVKKQKGPEDGSVGQTMSENNNASSDAARWIRYKHLQLKDKSQDKIFDHCFDAQSQSFSFYEFEILGHTVKRVFTHYAKNSRKEFDKGIIEKFNKKCVDKKEIHFLTDWKSQKQEDSESDKKSTEEQTEQMPEETKETKDTITDGSNPGKSESDKELAKGQATEPAEENKETKDIPMADGNSQEDNKSSEEKQAKEQALEPSEESKKTEEEYIPIAEGFCIGFVNKEDHENFKKKLEEMKGIEYVTEADFDEENGVEKRHTNSEHVGKVMRAISRAYHNNSASVPSQVSQQSAEKMKKPRLASLMVTKEQPEERVQTGPEGMGLVWNPGEGDCLFWSVHQLEEGEGHECNAEKNSECRGKVLQIRQNAVIKLEEIIKQRLENDEKEASNQSGTIGQTLVEEKNDRVKVPEEDEFLEDGADSNYHLSSEDFIPNEFYSDGCFVEEKKKQYIDNMIKSGVWGDHIITRALAEQHNATIYFYRYGASKSYQPHKPDNRGENTKVWHIYHELDYHFQAIMRNGDANRVKRDQEKTTTTSDEIPKVLKDALNKTDSGIEVVHFSCTGKEIYSQELCKKAPTALFVFGDNYTDRGTDNKGANQGEIRPMANAKGVCTLWTAGDKNPFLDTHLDVAKDQNGKTVKQIIAEDIQAIKNELVRTGKQYKVLVLPYGLLPKGKNTKECYSPLYQNAKIYLIGTGIAGIHAKKECANVFNHIQEQLDQLEKDVKGGKLQSGSSTSTSLTTNGSGTGDPMEQDDGYDDYDDLNDDENEGNDTVVSEEEQDCDDSTGEVNKDGDVIIPEAEQKDNVEKKVA